MLKLALEGFVDRTVDGKHIEPDQSDWDWGDEYQAKEFEASIAIERERILCRSIFERINAFLNEGGTIPAYISETLLDDVEACRPPTPAGSDEYSCEVLYARSPLKLRIGHSAPGHDTGEAEASEFVVLTFFSSRELAERIQMEIDRFISARGRASL